MVSEDRAPALDVPKAIDLAPVTIAQRIVANAKSLARCKTQYPDFPPPRIAVAAEGRPALGFRAQSRAYTCPGATT